MYIEPSRRILGPGGLDGSLATILQRLLHEAGAALERDGVAARACLDRAWALLESELSRVETRSVELSLGAGPERLAPWQARRALDYVNEMIGGPIATRDLAKLTRMSAACFSRAFASTFGMPPQEFIAMRRMNLACVLMLTTEDPLDRVALACGLSSEAQLAALFSPMFGCAPESWRWARRGSRL